MTAAVDLEALRLDLIGAYQFQSLTCDLVDDVVAALERAERVEAAARRVAADDAADNGDELVRHIFALRAALAPAPEGRE